MTWIKCAIHRNHPKVLAIANRAGIPKEVAFAVAVDWFRWVDENLDPLDDEGNEREISDTPVTMKHFGSIIECKKKAQIVNIFGAFCDQNWCELDAETDTIIVLDMQAHFGKNAKRRASEAKRVAHGRAGRTQPMQTNRAPEKEQSKNRTKEEEKTNNKQQEQNRVVVLDILSTEGINGKVAQDLYDGGATPAQVRVAIANADARPPRDRPAYIVAAVRDRYEPIQDAGSANTWERCCGAKTTPGSPGPISRTACRVCGTWYLGATGKPIPKSETANWRIPT